MTGRYADFVDYSTLDPVKKKALEVFTPTLSNPLRLRIAVKGLGETAAVLDFIDYDFMLAFNVEDLGTKNLVADAMYNELRSKAELAAKFDEAKFYSNLGRDAVAMAVTDLAAVGADPIAYADILASGDSSWFGDEKRVRALLEGYRVAADLAGCAIPQGETPTLQGVINPLSLNLSGGSVGIIRPKSRYIYGQKLAPGDVILGIPSLGICANGITKARKIAERVPGGYFARLEDGRTLGEAILEPTPILSRLVNQLLDGGVDLHYISPITGHGWRKIYRARFPFRYVIDTLPEPPAIFQALINWGREYGFDVSDEENYQVWNMGIFLALIAPREFIDTIASVAEKFKTSIFLLGRVEEGEREVIIKPKKISYRG
ncbi:MAG: AIR synthase related protein [Candidatus Bathyarchaeia archaeon]